MAGRKPTSGQIFLLQTIDARKGLYRATTGCEKIAVRQLRDRGWATMDLDGFADITKDGRAVIASEPNPLTA